VFFKAYYTEQVLRQYVWAFPRLVSYQRFVEFMPSALVPLCGYLQTRKGRRSGISFVDSTSVKVCHNRRIHSHKVFAGRARRGKTSVDCFYGFKLHLVVNDCGELLSLRLTPGNTDDRRPVLELTRGLFGKLFGDKGYVSQPLFEALYDEGMQLVTKLKRGCGTGCCRSSTGSYSGSAPSSRVSWINSRTSRRLSTAGCSVPTLDESLCHFPH
jgi:hypothetical protein